MSESPKGGFVPYVGRFARFAPYVRKIRDFGTGTVISAALGFAGTILAARVVSTEDFARMNMAVTVASSISAFTMLGFDQSLTREYFEVGDKGRLLCNSILIPSLVTALAAAATLAFSGSFSSLVFGTAADPALVAATLGLALFLNLYGVLLNFARMEGRGKLFSATSVLNKAVLVGLLVVAGFVPSLQTYRSLIFMNAAAGLAAILLLAIALRRNLAPSNWRIDPPLVRSMAHFGLPLVASNFMLSLVPTALLFLIRRHLSYIDLGIYSGAAKLVNVLTVIQQVFTVVWVPVSYSWIDRGYSAEKFVKVARLVSIGMLELFLGVFLLKTPLASILGERYLPSAGLLPFLSVQVVLYTISEVYIISVYKTRKTSLSIAVAAATLAAVLLTGSILVPLLGVTGAALANVAGYAAFFVIRYLFSKREWPGLRISPIVPELMAVILVLATYLALGDRAAMLLAVPFAAAAGWKLYRLIN